MFNSEKVKKKIYIVIIVGVVFYAVRAVSNENRRSLLRHMKSEFELNCSKADKIGYRI
jgi:hypothetical protein